MNKAALWLATAFWLVMMGLLLRVDVLPRYTVEETPGYESVVKDVTTPITREMAVFQGDEEVGTSHTVTMPNADGSFTITNVTTLTVRLAMLESRVTALLEVNLDSTRQVRDLFLVVSAGQKRAEVSGRRVGESVLLEVSVNGEKFTQEIPYDEAMFSSYFEPFALGSRLKAGQKWTTRFLDPLEGGTRTATVQVVGLEKLVMAVTKGGEPKEIEAYRVVMRSGEVELNAWATEEGVVLKEETPWGYTLYYRESEENDPAPASVEILRNKMRGQGIGS